MTKPPRRRSRTTSRRHAALIKAFSDDLGSELSTAQAALVRQAALLVLRCEQLEKEVLNGVTRENLDDVLIRLSGAATRILKSLGIEKRKVTKAQTIEEYIAGITK